MRFTGGRARNTQEVKRAALLLLVAAPLLVGGTADAATATLRLIDRDPIVVRATGFKPLERVRVTAYTRKGPFVHRTRATAAGRFVVRFRALSVESCEAAIALIRATGSRGSVATLRFRLRECAAPWTTFGAPPM